MVYRREDMTMTTAMIQPYNAGIVIARPNKKGDVTMRLTRKEVQDRNQKMPTETAKEYRLRINKLMDRTDTQFTEGVLDNLGPAARKANKRVKVFKMLANGDWAITLTNRESELDTEIAKMREKLAELEALKADSESTVTETEAETIEIH